MSDLLPILGKCLVAYLVGSIPSGYLLSRAVKGVDIRTRGSHNIGATNVSRVLGKKLGLVTLLLDAGKSFFVVKILLGTSSTELFLIPLGVLFGNCYSVFLKGKGGKGVATTFGIYLAVSPILFGIGFAAYILGIFVTRISAVGSMASAIVWPLASTVWLPEFLGISIIVSVLLMARHRQNIAELAHILRHSVKNSSFFDRLTQNMRPKYKK